MAILMTGASKQRYTSSAGMNLPNADWCIATAIRITDNAGAGRHEIISCRTGAPTVESVTTSTFATATTTPTISLSTTNNPGDLNLIMIAFDGNPVVTDPSGWTRLFYKNFDPVVDHASSGVWARVRVGGDSTSVGFTLSTTEEVTAHAYRITNWQGTIGSGVAFATPATSTSATPDPPSLTSGFGIVNTLWLAFSSDSGVATFTSGPTGYTDVTTTVSNLSTGGAAMFSARRVSLAASENTGIWTYTSGGARILSTIAIAPTSPALGDIGYSIVLNRASYPTDPGKCAVELSDGTNAKINMISTTQVPVGSWVLGVLQRTGGTKQLWVGAFGNVPTLQATSAATLAAITPTNVLRLGWRTDQNWPLDGAMAWLAKGDFALSSSQLYALARGTPPLRVSTRWTAYLPMPAPAATLKQTIGSAAFTQTGSPVMSGSPFGG